MMVLFTLDTHDIKCIDLMLFSRKSLDSHDIFSFAYNFLNNGPIVINFISFKSSWSPLSNDGMQSHIILIARALRTCRECRDFQHQSTMKCIDYMSWVSRVERIRTKEYQRNTFISHVLSVETFNIKVQLNAVITCRECWEWQE